MSHLERALMEEQAGNGAHKRTTLGPRFKSRNHYQLLVTYQAVKAMSALFVPIIGVHVKIPQQTVNLKLKKRNE